MSKLSVVVLLNGGLGTFLMELNYLQCLFNKFSENIEIEVCASNNADINDGLMKEQYFINSYCPRREFNSRECDLKIELNWFVKVVSFNSEKIEQASPELFDLINKWLNFQNNDKTKHLVGNDNRFDPNIWTYAISRNENRLNIADIDGSIGVGKEYAFCLKNYIGSADVLRKFRLYETGYITMQAGVDSAANTLCAPKQWPKEHYEKLCVLLKEKYPRIVLVQLGEIDNNLPINGVDLCLLGKTSFEELKIILKHSILHIDGDCGMLHMRKAMHAGPSVALWGQMAPEIVSYSDDINIVSDVCPTWCGKLYTGWKQRCPLYDYPRCMYEIKPQMVLERIALYIEKGKIDNKRCNPRENLESFINSHNIVIDSEWEEKWLSKQKVYSYSIQNISVADLKCRKLTENGYICSSIIDMPQYKFLMGDKKAYKEYMELNNLYNSGHEHSEKKYKELLDNLDIGINEENIIVVDGANFILDGVHRATYIAAKYGLESKINVLKLYGSWMIHK